MTNNAKPIGGLLIILGVSLAIGALIVTFYFWSSFLFAIDMHQSFHEETKEYRMQLSFAYFDVISTGLMMTLSFALFYVFLNKSKTFPKRYLQIWIVGAIIGILNTIIALLFFEDINVFDEKFFHTFIISAVWAVFWIGYLFKSNRAKHTFVR